MIKAEIIKDSQTFETDETLKGIPNRITTWILTYPRFIHSEFMTHRVFSRNASSSRAIPITKMIKGVYETPAVPVFWGANQKGMQASQELTGIRRWLAEQIWLKSRYVAICLAWTMNKVGLHKQISNRLLEPWMHITVVATATDMENFFKLRAHKDAQPEFQALAYKMLELYNQSIPKKLAVGQWHIPFDNGLEDIRLTTEDRLKIATARCARVSYLNFDGKADFKKDFEMHDRLSSSGHWSPFEHCAQATPGKRSGNFLGWSQYRKYFSNENATDPRVRT